MRAIVIGSGISGSHVALTLLERGHSIELWDVGRRENPISEPGITFHELKQRLPRPIDYFLGPNLDALIPPTSADLIHYPPSRRFLTLPEDPLWHYHCDGFNPVGSYARGGLANGWGANALAFDEDDLSDWPIGHSDMASSYKSVLDRIPVAGPEADELSGFLTGVNPSQAPVDLTKADRQLLKTYEKNRAKLTSIGVRMGQARLAVVTDTARLEACDYCDRCLWGCPRGSIYNPSESTLKACETFKSFTYKPGRFVLSLLSKDRVITAIRYLEVDTRAIKEEPCNAVFLAAGALQSGAIFLRSLKAARVDAPLESEGLMDTTVVKLPFLALRGIGKPAPQRAFQFNRLIMGLITQSGHWPRYLHGEVLHLGGLLYHPLIERLPFDSRFSSKLFFALKSALGVVTLFYPDRLHPGNRQVLLAEGERWEGVKLSYRETADKESYISQTIPTVRSALRQLGCVPRSELRSAPGAGIHYAGTIPMGDGPRRCDSRGRAHSFSNLYIADGAAFPTLPSKSISITLAAHATRVAQLARL